MSILNDVILDEDLEARGFVLSSVADDAYWKKQIGIFTIWYTPHKGFSIDIDDGVLNYLQKHNPDCFEQLLKLTEIKQHTLDEADAYIDDFIQKTYLCTAIACGLEMNQIYMEQAICRLQEQVERLMQTQQNLFNVYENACRHDIISPSAF